jgi:hypothetical protein
MHSCDYYIIKQLKISYINDDDDECLEIIEINRCNGYFSNSKSRYYYDDDESDSDSDSEKKRQNMSDLKVAYKPRFIFKNEKWKSDTDRVKYQNLITEELGHIHIISIIKCEIRCLS